MGEATHLDRLERNDKAIRWLVPARLIGQGVKVVREVVLVGPQLIPLAICRSGQDEGAWRELPLALARGRVGVERCEIQHNLDDVSQHFAKRGMQRSLLHALSPSSSRSVIQKLFAQSVTAIDVEAREVDAVDASEVTVRDLSLRGRRGRREGCRCDVPVAEDPPSSASRARRREAEEEELAVDGMAAVCDAAGPV